MRRALLLAAWGLTACRTEIAPIVKPEAPRAEAPRAAKTGCDVHDYESATDVPTGARELGPVEVKREESDEATYVSLRQAICALGGDALSGLAWIKQPGDTQPTALRANAWQLP